MQRLRLVLPKGRIFDSVLALMGDAGFGMDVDERLYVPRVEDPELECKIMKPQNIPRLLEIGSHDAGFTGYDWIVETGADIDELLDLGFNPVRIVAAVPEELAGSGYEKKKLLVVSEYERLAREFLDRRGYTYVFLKSYGATEVFPPDDADMIIDNISTGRTLIEHNLVVVDTLMESSTRFVASREAMADPSKSEKIREMKMLFQSVLDARERVMLEMNVPKEKLESIVKELPCMRSPTVAPLWGEQGYAVKIAVKRKEVARLIPQLKKLGATDILEYEFRKVVV
jgi:ATP phosphoribosyltransferase